MPTNYTEKEAAANPPKSSAVPARLAKPKSANVNPVARVIRESTTGENVDDPEQSAPTHKPTAFHDVTFGIVPGLKKGGPIKKTGIYKLHAGEHVLTAAETKKARKHALMASGMKSLAKAGKNAAKK